MTQRQDVDEILRTLKSLGNPKAIEGMAHFGINARNTYGVSIPKLRGLARQIKQNHTLAQQLWTSGIHEARILASMIDEPQRVTDKQMERWVRDFDSWDVCDQVCMNLFEDTPFAYKKAIAWSKRREEFVKRAGFVMMARLAVSDKNANDDDFLRFLSLIKKEAVDERNFVKKAVNWALRQIGKRSKALNRLAAQTAREIKAIDSKAAKWIATDALRELESKAVQARFK
jgi:3-methyladenine DNA glycosylase AlkD